MLSNLRSRGNYICRWGVCMCCINKYINLGILFVAVKNHQYLLRYYYFTPGLLRIGLISFIYLLE